MRLVASSSGMVLVDDKMRIIPEVLEFAQFLKQRGKSVNTVQSYLESLQKFYDWLEHEQMEFYAVKPKHMQDFIRYLDAAHPQGRVSAASLNRHLAALSSFYNFHKIMGGWVGESPVVKEEGNRVHNGFGFLRHVVKPLGKEVTHYFKRKAVKSKVDRKRLDVEQARMFYQRIGDAWAEDPDLVVRNKLIFKILYETGMRIGELLHLQLDDVENPNPGQKTGNIYLVDRKEEDPDRQLKSGERAIAVRNELLEEIDRYVMDHRPYVDGVKYLIVNHGNPVGQPSTRSNIEAMFRQVSTEIGIKCTPHSLRHTHASNLADMGMDPLFIKTRLGHSSLETTAKYAVPSLNAQIAAYENYVQHLERSEGEKR